MVLEEMEKVRYIVYPRTDDEYSLSNRKSGDRLKKKKCYIYTRVSAMAQTEGYILVRKILDNPVSALVRLHTERAASKK